MPPWAYTLLALAIVALVTALVAALVALRRVALRAESVLGILETEIRPLIADTHGVLEEVRTLTRQANREMERVGALAERAEEVAAGLGGLVRALSGFTRVGQLLGVVVGVKKGVDVFLTRLTRGQGEHHG